MSDVKVKVRVAISTDFLTAFATIPRRQQNKVASFINKFRNNPTSPGINYEKVLNAFDPSIRSVRIDDTYRGIVSKPKNSNIYLLLWVDHHDDAYKWAVRKKCMVNAQTGSIQVFDMEESTQPLQTTDTVLENKVETVKPQITEPIEPIFKDISDEVLIKVGVPEETLALVRKITSIAKLDENINLLPSDAYEALYFLAEGYSVEEVLEVCAKNDDEEVDTEDFEIGRAHV